MDKKLRLPCKDCITLSICKAFVNNEDLLKEAKKFAGNLYSSDTQYRFTMIRRYLVASLTDRCSMITEYCCNIQPMRFQEKERQMLFNYKRIDTVAYFLLSDGTHKAIRNE